MIDTPHSQIESVYGYVYVADTGDEHRADVNARNGWGPGLLEPRDFAWGKGFICDTNNELGADADEMRNIY
jgi:hypothetical protein